MWGLAAGLLATAAGTIAGAFVRQFTGAEIKRPPQSWLRYRSNPRSTLGEARAAALTAAAVIAGYTLFLGWMARSVLVLELHRGKLGVPAGVLTALLALGLMYRHFCRTPATAAWPKWLQARARLARKRLLPWRLMTFLADARQRGILTQTGATYQFRHILLQHRLASRTPTWLRE